MGRFSTYPQFPAHPHSPVYDDRVPYVPPPVPELPHSPTYSTASSQTYSTYSNDSSNGLTHWASKIFDGRHSSTPFRILGQSYVKILSWSPVVSQTNSYTRTKCLGRDEPIAVEMLENDGFIKVLEL